MLFAFCVFILAVMVVSFPAVIVFGMFYPDLAVKILLGMLVVGLLAWAEIKREERLDAQSEEIAAVNVIDADWEKSA